MLFTIFKHFFWLGCISFGGPAAHIGYFNQKFVKQLKWLSQEEYGHLVSLSQFLPGPGSSQVGFALGYRKGGIWGALTAFTAFTLPSMLLMIILATISYQLIDNRYFYGVTHGLKLLAVIVVFDAVLSMYQSFCKEKLTQLLALLSAVVLLFFSSWQIQLLLVLLAGVLGALFLTNKSLHATKQVKISYLPLMIFVGLLACLPWLKPLSAHWQLVGNFYQAGSMVFGGGHVVLPLLQELLGNNMPTDTFLTGYAAAQAVPGPMFTLATFLGYHLLPSAPFFGAVLATLAIFLPGFLLMLAFLKHWQGLAAMPKVAGAMQAINAAVVGLLISALYQPVFTAAVIEAKDMAVVLMGLYLLKQWQTPIVYLVLGFAVTGVLLTI